MSYRSDRILALHQVEHLNYANDLSSDTLKDLYLEVLHNGLHGICFSIYEDGQKPGSIISLEQVRRRMAILKPHTEWVRSFSCIEGNEYVTIAAKEMGIKTLTGAWLSDDKEQNELEIAALIDLCNKGYVDIAAVGNEVMYREDLTEVELIEYIKRVKDAVKDVPVSYVDAYYEFTDRPAITDLCDVILANCYPFWEGCPFEDSLSYMKKMYYQALDAAGGKRVIISETGWPTKGENVKGALPSEINALKYFINAQMWSIDAGVEMFYFSSFDESWKVSKEGEVGAYWGLWDKNEKLKFVK